MDDLKKEAAPEITKEETQRGLERASKILDSLRGLEAWEAMAALTVCLVHVGQNSEYTKEEVLEKFSASWDGIMNIRKN